MKHRIPIAIAVVLLLAAGLAWHFWPRIAPAPEPPPAVVASTPAAPATPATPQIAHPLPGSDDATLLPALAAADEPLAAALLALPGAQGLGKLLVPQALLRHFVATIDNLPRHHLAAEQRPLHATPGPFLVAGDDQSGTADARNAARYAPALAVLQGIDPNALYRLYRHWYPLLQRAYQDLGYPDGYFNDRMVAAVDDLLAAPQPATAPRLLRPNVLWVYADDDLEGRSAGQRLMLRLPAEQAQQLRARLAVLRKLLVSGPPATAAGGVLG